MRAKKRKAFGKARGRKLPALLAALALCLSLSGNAEYRHRRPLIPDSEESSWSYISPNWLAATLADPGWERIVQDSPFRLGDVVRLDHGYYDYERSYGTYPSIDGSTVAMPMVVEFARQHLDLPEPELVAFVSLSTTQGAYFHLIEGRSRWAGYESGDGAWTVYDERHPVDLVIATHPSAAELAWAVEEGVELVIEPVCRDAFVFITHADNPVDNLTTEQIRGIYSGAVTNWREVGGRRQRIVAYQRNPGSGSQTAMEEMVMDGLAMADAPPRTIIMGMGGMIDVVAGYQNDFRSIGYTYSHYLDVLYPNENIKVLSVDGVYPDSAAVQSGEYAYSTYYYGVIRAGEEDGAGGRFLAWMLGEEGQRCIGQAGYIPLRGG